MRLSGEEDTRRPHRSCVSHAHTHDARARAFLTHSWAVLSSSPEPPPPLAAYRRLDQRLSLHKFTEFFGGRAPEKSAQLVTTNPSCTILATQQLLPLQRRGPYSGRRWATNCAPKARALAVGTHAIQHQGHVRLVSSSSDFVRLTAKITTA